MSADTSNTDHPDDLIDIEAMMRADPRLAEAVHDAEERHRLRATLVGIRKDRGLTQKEVARLMETTQSAVSDLERGGVDPHLSTLQRYARAVGAQVRVTTSLSGLGSQNPAEPEQSSPDGPARWLRSVRAIGYRRASLDHRAS